MKTTVVTTTIISLASLMLVGCSDAANTLPKTQAPFLIDGVCDEDAWDQTPHFDIGGGATLDWLQDENYLYMCLSITEGSYGTFDLYYLDPSDGQPVDLHVSAQIGERKLVDGVWPDYLWWNNTAWTANNIEMQYTDNKRSGFVEPAGHELQANLLKLANDKGEITLMLHVRALMSEDGTRSGNTAWPNGAKVDDPATWTTLHVTR